MHSRASGHPQSGNWHPSRSCAGNLASASVSLGVAALHDETVNPRASTARTASPECSARFRNFLAGWPGVARVQRM